MFLLQRPSQQAIDRFLNDSKDLPLSYGPIGIVDGDTSGRDLDEATVAIGRGTSDFERARAALMVRKQLNIGWLEVFSPHTTAAVGTVVAVLIHHMGFWSLNGCRVIYNVGEGDVARFGYAHGTLINHAEAGEETFEVFLDPRTDAVMYRIRAMSWPRARLARAGQPVVRLLQARFRRDSAAAMKRAMHSRGVRA
ncbi:MAG TPA: DUF1990 domain-containing protein [Vicinamibacterales bacterium]|nr:DUF1990 domain-containing protein [Vicinamibacterales bacterium]